MHEARGRLLKVGRRRGEAESFPDPQPRTGQEADHGRHGMGRREPDGHCWAAWIKAVICVEVKR